LEVTLGGAVRYVVFVGLFLMMTINFIDRINLSVAGGAIAAAYQLSPIELGYLFSAYSWTYTASLIPIGLMVDRWGTRAMLGAAMAVWSIGGMLTGAVVSYPALIASRLVLGAGEAAGFPAGSRVIREWTPRSERGLAIGFINAGTYLGPAVGAVFVGWLISISDWRTSFYVTGAIGVVYGAVWYALYRTPEQASFVGAAEKAKILSERDHEGTGRGALSGWTALGVLVRSRTLWAIFLTQACAAYSLYLFVAWLPGYFQATRGTDILKTAGLTAVPYLVTAVLVPVVSWISDRYLGNDVAGGRRRNLIAVTLLIASVLMAVPYASSLAGILAILTVSLTGLASGLSLNMALANDLLRRSEATATATGFIFTGGNIAGIISPIVTGYIVAATGQFDAAFTIAGTLLALGAVISFALTRESIGAESAGAGETVRETVVAQSGTVTQ
jgi:ACS family glucarate transporter-like MFS transporter